MVKMNSGISGRESSAVAADFDARNGARARARPVDGNLSSRHIGAMRIATWNVNSLKARLDKVAWWIDRAAPDVLLLQETKLADADAPYDFFSRLGYELAHHGQGRWNGVAIASRIELTGVTTSFGRSEHTASAPEAGDEEPLAEARVISAFAGKIRFVNVYAPNGRAVKSRFYNAKLVWFDCLIRWIGETARPDEPFVLGGDFNIAADDRDVWDATACHGGTHVSPPEREAFQRLLRWGLTDAYRKQFQGPERYTWWDYRAGDFYKNYGMRIDHILVTEPVAKRIVAAEIDREARKGKPTPSDHAPLVVDLDEPGRPFDAGWESAEERIAARRAKVRSSG
jgi:exodeoxyribonuclease-3